MTTRPITRRYNAILAPIGLEVTEFSLLVALQMERHSSITELADQLAFERTTLVRDLKHMTERSLIEPASPEGRAVKYVLTQKGLSLLKRRCPPMGFCASLGSSADGTRDSIESAFVAEDAAKSRKTRRLRRVYAVVAYSCGLQHSP